MDHVAIMKKSWGLTEKILSGQKKIESRWYVMKCRPWNKVAVEDTIYFKNSGEPVCMKAEVKNVLQFENLTPEKVKQILKKYGKDDGLEKEKLDEFFEMFKNKKYCILIFLKKVVSVRPFNVDKTGFGAMSAWLSVPNISKIKKRVYNIKG